MEVFSSIYWVHSVNGKLVYFGAHLDYVASVVLAKFHNLAKTEWILDFQSSKQVNFKF